MLVWATVSAGKTCLGQVTGEISMATLKEGKEKNIVFLPVDISQRRRHMSKLNKFNNIFGIINYMGLVRSDMQ